MAEENSPLLHIVGEDDYAIYEDETYQYVCEAHPGAALSASKWRIRRITLAGDRVEWCGGTRLYKWAATDLATVQGHFA